MFNDVVGLVVGVVELEQLERRIDLVGQADASIRWAITPMPPCAVPFVRAESS